MNHEFYKDVDWIALKEKKVKSLLEFQLKGKKDLKYFDTVIINVDSKITYL